MIVERRFQGLLPLAEQGDRRARGRSGGDGRSRQGGLVSEKIIFKRRHDKCFLFVVVVVEKCFAASTSLYR